MNSKVKSILIKVLVATLFVTMITLLIWLVINQSKTIKKQEIALITIEMAFDNADYDSIETKYNFIDKRKAVYIEQLSKEVGVDADLVFAVLMRENPKFDVYAINRNANGTIDVGYFQPNDYYLWTDFVPHYWIADVQFDPFNWKHNSYIAIHHIAWLQEKLKVEDDVIMAYNCGLNAVMNDCIPTSTRETYLVEVKNNLNMLRNYNSNSMKG